MSGALTAGGRRLAARLTGGSLLRFKRETGRDFLRTAEDADSEDLMHLAWLSLADRDRGPGYEEFCDSLSMAEVNGLGLWLNAELREGSEADSVEAGGGAKKKG